MVVFVVGLAVAVPVTAVVVPNVDDVLASGGDAPATAAGGDVVVGVGVNKGVVDLDGRGVDEAVDDKLPALTPTPGPFAATFWPLLPPTPNPTPIPTPTLFRAAF